LLEKVSVIMSHTEDPAFEYDNDVESGYHVPVIDEQREYGSVASRPPLTPMGMTVREERRTVQNIY